MNLYYETIEVPPTISSITDSAIYVFDYSLIVMRTHEAIFAGAEAFIQYFQDKGINTYGDSKLELTGILAVLIQAGAPVDEAIIVNTTEEFGKSNILDTKIHAMQHVKRHGITGKHYMIVYSGYENVTDEILKRIEDIEDGLPTNSIKKKQS